MSKLKIFILSILTTFSLYSEQVLKEMVITYNKIGILNLKQIVKYSYTNTSIFLYLILTIFLIYFYSKHLSLKTKKSYNILSLFFSFFLVFGYSYSIISDSSLVTGNIILIILSIIKFITYYIFLKTILNLLINKIKTFNFSSLKIPKIFTKFQNYYEKHTFKTTIIILLICYLPYIISFYPAILSPDPSNQIKQYYNLPTHYIEGVKLIDNNVLITNHHPVFHTFILGGFTKLGDNLINLNFGLFLFTLFQTFLVTSALTYLLVYLKKLKLPFIYRFICLLIFALVPVFPLYTLSSVKDTFFGALLIFYLIEMHKLLTNTKYKFINYLTLSLLCLFMMLVRNNGLIIILFSFPFLIYFYKSKKLPLILVLLSSISIYEIHNKVLLPSMHITSGSIREMLSIPFQQTARYVTYYSKDLTTQDIKVIDKILNYDTLKDRYKPNISDPVKNEFNKDTTSKDLMNYFQVWFKCFFKHPGVYFDATINTVYGYFYPNTSNWYVYYNYDTRLIESNLDYHYNNLKIPRTILSSYAVAYPYIPLIGSIVNIGLIVWTYLFMLCICLSEKKKSLITLLMPALSLILVLVAGPVNTYFRYVFPILISLPLLIGIIYLELKKSS